MGGCGSDEERLMKSGLLERKEGGCCRMLRMRKTSKRKEQR